MRLATLISRFVLLFLLISNALAGQVSESSYITLRKELVKKVNALRLDLGLPILKNSIILRKAAKNQCLYMVKSRKLTHKQGNRKLANPLKRVRNFKGYEFERVGENVLHTKPVKLPLRNKYLELLADEMFMSWKNSPGHYENMINPDYEFSGIDFMYSPKEKIIYAAQVFGKRGVQIPGQLSNSAFGIEDKEEPCDCELYGYSNILANMGNSVRLDGNKVVFYYYDLQYFNKIFKDSKDGIAIDLVYRDQLSCDGPSRIDYSPVYDGILLEPMYRYEILRQNIAESDYRIISQIATIPDSLMSKEFSCSIVVIEKGKMCKYLIPGDVPSRSYSLKNIEPKLLNPSNIALKKTGIMDTKEYAYSFVANQTNPVKLPVIDLGKQSIHSIDITSYSSVEGGAQKNTTLHNQRAQNIKRHLLSKIADQNTRFTIDAKENWDKMYFQLRYFFADELAAMSKDSLKFLLTTDDNKLPWDSLLFEQRKSVATINFAGTISDTTDLEKLLIMNFKTALSTKNYDLANKALFKMQESNIYPSKMLFEDAVFKAILTVPQITQNVAALLNGTYRSDMPKAIEFLFCWLNEDKDLSVATKHNLINLYTLLSEELLNNWDISAKRLSNVIHPSVIRRLMDDGIESELLLNLNLTFIKYFGQVNDGPNISKAFDYIVDYFSAGELEIEDDIKLALFFNHWSRYDLTKKHLLSNFDKVALSEEAIFILLQTLFFYTENGDDAEMFEKVYLKALDINQKKWCLWVDTSFQILRNQKLKALYCDKCFSN